LAGDPIPTPVDVDLAGRQWQGYVDALRAEGWEIIEVPPADDCPDAVFVEDTVVVHGDLAVIARPGADERKPEIAGTEATLASLGYRIARTEQPGTLDGGDVLKGAAVVWVGVSGRTNACGVEQLAELLRPLSARVVGVRVSRVLHVKSCVTALPDGTIVGFAPLVDDPGLWPSFLSVPEETGSRCGARLIGGPDVHGRTGHASRVRVPRAPCGHRGHFRIREAGRRCHLPVRSTRG
jgi:dimethylargininase